SVTKARILRKMGGYGEQEMDRVRSVGIRAQHAVPLCTSRGFRATSRFPPASGRSMLPRTTSRMSRDCAASPGIALEVIVQVRAVTWPRGGAACRARKTRRFPAIFSGVQYLVNSDPRQCIQHDAFGQYLRQHFGGF